MKWVDFFVDKFDGIGLGFSFGTYDYHIYFVATFLCFNFYFEFNLGKIN